jgi:cardiolipin synthase
MRNRTLEAGPGTARGAVDYALGRATISQNRATLLPGGADAFPAMLADIRAARREVLLESYILADDATGNGFLAALAEAAQRGCTARLICDGVGCLRLPAARLAEAERAGVQTLVYRPIAPWRRHWGWWRRDHRKTLVVDGQVGFLGGLNLADEYDDRRGVGPGWRDLHLRLEGPAAEALAQLFLRTWNAESPAARRMVRHGRSPLGPVPAEPRDAVPVEIVGNGVLRNRWRIRRSFLHAVKRSQRSVTIANPYFIPDRAVSRALIRAARRGVDVRVVVPARSDVLLCDLAARAVFPRLLRCGVRVAEWPHGMMHAKAAAVDGSWATVGSFNLDRRSLRYNLEVTANLFDGALAARIEGLLRADFAEAVPIDAEVFAARPLVERALEFGAYQLRALL